MGMVEQILYLELSENPIHIREGSLVLYDTQANKYSEVVTYQLSQVQRQQAMITHSIIVGNLGLLLRPIHLDEWRVHMMYELII